jgi:hypothetical protein
MIMFICHALVAMLTLGMFIGTLKINTKNEIPQPLASSPSVRGNRNLPADFDFWN